MGRKYPRKRQYLYIFFAFLIPPLVWGCAAIKTLKNRHIDYKLLQTCQKHLEKRDFKEALKENQNVLSIVDEAPHKDAALFNMGLIYAHYRNPEKDYEKSRIYFEKLIQQFPQSPFFEQAKIWASVLEDISHSKIKSDEISLSSKYLNRGQEFLSLGKYKEALQENQKVLSLFDKALYRDKALFNIGLIYAHYDNPEKDYEKSRMHFEKLVQQFPQSPFVEQAKIWLGIFNVIEREKQVDIEIEKKKKELTR